MKSGLIGLPGSGATTVFCLFCGRSYRDIASSGKSEVNLGEARVPDSRVDRLSEIFQPKKAVYATIEFADVPVEVDTSGAFSATTVNSIRNMDSLVVVLRSFTNPTVPHPKGSVNPLRDIQSLWDEALLTDLLQVEKKLEKISKEGRLKTREAQIFLELKTGLEASVPIRDQHLADDTVKEISGYRFLTEKPWLVVINTDPGQPVSDELLAFLQTHALPGLPIAGQFELELLDLPDVERSEFLSDMGLSQGALDRFVNMVYRKLNLISFLTFGDDECRAWSLTARSDAVEAAGRIHSDLARGFIRAEVVSFDDFVACGCTIQAVKKAGKLRMEGKKYQVQDGDMLTILFNV